MCHVIGHMTSARLCARACICRMHATYDGIMIKSSVRVNANSPYPPTSKSWMESHFGPVSTLCSRGEGYVEDLDSKFKAETITIGIRKSRYTGGDSAGRIREPS